MVDTVLENCFGIKSLEPVRKFARTKKENIIIREEKHARR